LISDETRCARLSSICSEWGGGLHVVPRRLWRDDLSFIEFMYPVAHDWASCHVFIDRPEAWPYAVHEMAHCFAMRFPVEISGPVEPVGWQFLLACALDVDAGRDWLTFYRTYGLNVGKDFREMSDEEIAFTIAWHVNRDRGLDLIDGFSPVPLRRGPGLVLSPPLLPGPSYVRVAESYVNP
jgi:hypothetical protein